jgi:hypothetical protein
MSNQSKGVADMFSNWEKVVPPSEQRLQPLNAGPGPGMRRKGSQDELLRGDDMQ